MKRLLVALGLILVAALAAPLVLSGVVDWNAYKDIVAARIGGAIGHHVEIDGELHMALLPTPLLSVGGVRIANAPGFGEADMVRLKRLDATIALLPLLGGRIQVEKVLLDEPDVVYDIDADGISNWRSTSVDAPFGLDLAAAVSFDGVVVRDGRLLYRNRRTGREESVDGIGASIAASSLNGPFQATGALTVRGVEVQAEITGGRYASGVAMPLRATFTLPGGGAVVRFAGIVAGGEAGGPRFRGDIKAEGANLAGTLMPIMAGFADGAVPPKALDQPFALRALLDADAGHLLFNSVEAQLGDSRGSGTVAVAVGAEPDIQVALNVNHVDADPWLGFDIHSLAAALPRDVTGALALGSDSLTLAGGALRQFRLEAKLTGATIAIDRLSALLPGGADISAVGSLGPEDGQPTLDLQMEANADNLRSILEWLHADLTAVPADRLRKASLSGRLRGVPGRYDVTGIDLRFDASRVTGGLSYVDRRGRPAFGIELDVDRLNADAYGVNGTAASVLAHRLAEAADVSLKATAGNLTLAGMVVQGVALDTVVVGGVADVRELKIADVAGAAVGLEGRLLGPTPDSPAHVTLDISGDTPTGLAHVIAWPAWLPSPESFGSFQVHARLIGKPERMAVELKGDALGVSVDAAGTVEKILDAPTFDAKVRTTTADAAALLRRLRDGRSPASAAVPADLYAAVSGNTDKLAFDDVQGNLGGSAVRGHWTLILDGTRPRLDGEIQVTDAQIDRALMALLDVRQGSDSLDLSWLRRADAALALTAANATLFGQKLDNTAARLRLADGALKIEQLDATLYGGRLGLSGQVDVGSDAAPSVSADVTLSKARPTDLILPGGLRLAAESLDAEASLTTAGSSAQAMMRALSGKGWLAARDGSLMGVDPGAALDRLKRGDDDTAASDERATFSAASASVRIERGAVRSDDLRMTGAAGTVRVSGEWRPADDGIDARVSLDGHDGSGDQLVFRVTGPVDHPRKTLETATLPVDAGTAGGDAKPASSAADVIRGLLQGLRR